MLNERDRNYSQLVELLNHGGTRQMKAGSVVRLAFGALALTLFAAPTLAAAKPGDRDPTFGAKGSVLIGLPASPVAAKIQAVARQGDGKVVVAGRGGAYGNITRLNPDGTVDESFGDKGVITTRFSDADRVAQINLAVQPDQNILVSGLLDTDGRGGCCALKRDEIFVARFLPSGLPDPSFGDGDGLTVSTTSLNLPLSVNMGHLLEIQPDGKILAASLSTLIRLMPDGTPDKSFGNEGAANFGFYFITAITLQPNAGIVVSTDRRLFRLTPSGKEDPEFGSGGHVDISSSIIGNPADVAVQESGRIVLASSYGPGTEGVFPPLNAHPRLQAFTPAGAVDTSFGGGDGVAAIPDTSELPSTVGLRAGPDGALTVAGSFGIRRFSADGAPDGSFGNGGAVDIRALGSTAVLGDGRLIVASAYTPDVNAFTNDGLADPTFGGDGSVAIGGFRDVPDAWPVQIVAQPGGGFVVLAEESTPSGLRGTGLTPAPHAVLFRLTPHGVVDPTFGGEGTVGLSSPSASVAVRGNGTAIVLGTDGALSAYTPDGSRVPGFGREAPPTPTGRDATYDSYLDATLEPAGTILAAVETNCIYCGGPYSSLVRFSPDGSRERSIGLGGLADNESLARDGGTIPTLARSMRGIFFGAQPFEGPPFIVRERANGESDPRWGAKGVTRLSRLVAISDVLPLPDGGALFSGVRGNSIGVVEKLSRTGHVIRRFGGKGYARSAAGPSLAPSALVRQPGGRILLAEAKPRDFSVAGSHGRIHLTRFRPNGAVDPSFGRTGRGLDLPFNPGGDLITQGAGKILLTSAAPSPTGNRIRITRLLAGETTVRHHPRDRSTSG